MIPFHRILLNDTRRMEAFRHAIQLTVRAGDVVLDVGTGSGIMALFACQAGAERVYAVDKNEIIGAAGELAKANGFGERIVFLQQDVREVQLPEPVDVIVSELIGKAVLGQKMSDMIGHCQRRFLKPGGRVIPSRVTLHVAPIDDKRPYLEARLPDKSRYDIDFSPMQTRSFNCCSSARIPAEALLAAGQSAHVYDSSVTANEDAFAATLVFQPAHAGVLHGFAAWFVAVLADGVELTNEPPGMASWDNMVFPLSEPVAVEPDMVIELRFRGRNDSQARDLWCWDTTVRQQERTVAEHRQSTFLGEIKSLKNLYIPAADHAPKLTQWGEVDKFVLTLMDGTNSLDEIARQTWARFPERFAKAEESLKRVRDLMARYGG